MHPNVKSHSYRPFVTSIGVEYEELPIVHINATYNNTIVTITDHAGTWFCSII